MTRRKPFKKSNCPEHLDQDIHDLDIPDLPELQYDVPIIDLDLSNISTFLSETTEPDQPEISGPISSNDVAQWMTNEIWQRKYLNQQDAASMIRKRFGAQFIYANPNGNWAINKLVLAAFRKLTGDEIVWSRSERIWRHRTPDDAPTREQY